MENNLTEEVKDRLFKKIRESAISNNGVYFIDSTSREFDLMLFPLLNMEDGEKLCSVKVPEKYQKIFRSGEITLTFNNRTKHLEYPDLRHWMVNSIDFQFGRDYQNALSLRKEMISMRVESLYKEAERLITLKTRYK